MMQQAAARLGQSFNSAGIVLFARIATVRLAAATVWCCLLRPCWPSQLPPEENSLTASSNLSMLAAPLHICEPYSGVCRRRATARWRCRTLLCPTCAGWTGMHCDRPASRAASLTRTTR
jgi:hypothetical protein